MMRSYASTPWAAAFFISYLSVNLYFLMNLMLAVVYDAFTRIEKVTRDLMKQAIKNEKFEDPLFQDKYRKLFLHKRKAAQHAFHLLVTKERPDEVNFTHFEGLLKAYKGITSPTEAYLVFKLLNKSGSGYLRLEEFYGKNLVLRRFNNLCLKHI